MLGEKIQGPPPSRRPAVVGKLVILSTQAKAGGPMIGKARRRRRLNDITVLSDTANTAARLASLAKAGEIVASEETVRQAGITTEGLKRENCF